MGSVRTRQWTPEIRGRGVQRTSPPATVPVFLTLNETSNIGRCSQIAVELPSVGAATLPAAQAVSNDANVWSDSCTFFTFRLEYVKFVYESPKPNSKRGSMLFCPAS